jgi:hypothetical protein
MAILDFTDTTISLLPFDGSDSDASTLITVQKMAWTRITELHNTTKAGQVEAGVNGSDPFEPDSTQENLMEGTHEYAGSIVGIADANYDISLAEGGELQFIPGGGSEKEYEFTILFESVSIHGGWNDGGPLIVSGQWRGEETDA